MHRKFSIKIKYLSALLLLTWLAGCDSINLPFGTPPVATPGTLTPGTSVASLTPSLTERPPDTEEPPVVSGTPDAAMTPSGSIVLHLWLPPGFDPEASTPAAELLKARLEEFSRRRPGIRTDVRIKALEGTGGLLDSLTTASAAAPLALPDLVVLPRPTLETAALKGLLHPFDGLTNVLDNPDWYDFARQLAHLQNSTFGLPIGGDALVLVYRPTVVSAPPADWASMLTMEHPLAFAASDPQALVTLGYYQFANGPLVDEQGRPTLVDDPLIKVLDFYQQAEQNGVLPYWITQYQSDEQAWQAFVSGETDMVITWMSRYLTSMQADTAIAPIPTETGELYTLANGWVLALSTPHTDRQTLGAELAEYLTDSDFLSQWSQAGGFIPPQPSALSGWTDGSLQAQVARVAASARLIPSTDLITSLGPPLQEATVAVLKEQSDPQMAARTAIDKVTNP
jgi:multiple sugar transport system substrate-binding protein